MLEWCGELKLFNMLNSEALMTIPNDPLYYAARAEVARKLASKALDREIRQMHEQMARDYESLALDLERPRLRHAATC